VIVYKGMETILALEIPTRDEAADVSAQQRLEQLFDAHRDRLFHLALRLTGGRDEALDLVQETFVRATRRLHAIPEPEPAAGRWLVRVLVNLVRDRWRRQRRRGVDAELPVALPAPGSPQSRTVARLAVHQALATLAPRRRAIVVMTEMDGKTSREAAEVLGMRPVTVRWHLAAARKQLQEVLAPYAAPKPSPEATP